MTPNCESPLALDVVYHSECSASLPPIFLCNEQPGVASRMKLNNFVSFRPFYNSHIVSVCEYGSLYQFDWDAVSKAHQVNFY